jgi:uncharacterized protein (TIGR03435 family)
MRIALTAGSIAIFSSLAFGQTPAPAPAFEVASIKPSAPLTGNNFFVRMRDDPGRVNLTSVTLRNVLMRAYKVKEHQIVAPDWMNSERFDIVAKLPEGAQKEQIPQMLQALLADRFKLTLHREQKVMPVYALMPAKGGVKLPPAEASGRIQASVGPKGRHLTGKMTIAQFADMLSNFLDRPVLDRSETKAAFDIDLEWTGGDSNMRIGGPMGPAPPPRPEGAETKEPNENADAPSIFTAIQEKLGLRLEAQKAPVEILIIDHAEKLPTEN